jgi:hypothetical protein
MNYQDYVTYVQEQIKLFEKYTHLIDDALGEITPQIVNYNLAHYTNVNIALNAEYQRKKNHLSRTRRDFQLWWDEKFVTIRRAQNPASSPASKWLSKQEIESETRAQYKDEYLKWREDLDDLEDQVSFIQRLLQQWSDHGKMLTTLSQNMRQEMLSLGIQDRVNKTEPHRRHTFTDSTYEGPNASTYGQRTRKRKATNRIEDDYDAS